MGRTQQIIELMGRLAPVEGYNLSVLDDVRFLRSNRPLHRVPDLIMQSMRSHDQYNTTIYGLDDRYRGVKGQRDVLFVNEADIIRLGFKPGQKADIVSLWEDGRERRVKGFTLLAFDIPAGQAAAYYPEVNPLVPLESTGDGSHTPTSKFVAIRLEAASDNGLIIARTA